MATPTSTSVQNIGSSFGAAASSLFSGFASQNMAAGYAQSAAGYTKSAAYARKNAEYATKNKDVQLQMADRQIYQGIGGTEADIAGAGFSRSGSAIDLLIDSAQQGELQKELVTIQGDIQIAGYNQQADALETQASVALQQEKAAKNSATGSFMSSGIMAAAGMVMMFSDRRVKFAIRPTGEMLNGLPVYLFRYMWKPWRVYRGLMADEVKRVFPKAVSTLKVFGYDTGIMRVDYNMVMADA